MAVTVQQLKEKFILDACCGGRTFWFDKTHKNTLYVDNNPRPCGYVKQRPNFNCSPDVVMDFRNLEFENNKFNLVVFDPPHLKSPGKNGWMNKKYGRLDRKTWKDDLKLGFKECFRVLKSKGVLIFKWNEMEIPLKDILELTSYKPLFGHTSGRQSKTIWVCFMKTK